MKIQKENQETRKTKKPVILTLESSVGAAQRAFQELKGDFSDLFGGPLVYDPGMVITNLGFVGSGHVNALYLGFPTPFEGVTSDQLKHLSSLSVPMKAQIHAGMVYRDPLCAISYFRQTLEESKTPLVIADSPADARNWAEERQRLHDAIRKGSYEQN
jgi:hypothetical protein